MTSNRRFRIAVMPGDGIGPEVIDAALAVLEAATGDGAGFALDFEHLTAGAGAWRDTGTAMSEPTFERAKAADAVLLGAMGLPDVRYADGTEIAPQLDLRFRLGLYAGVRPVRALPGGARLLADPRGADIDLVIVRESTEGLFASRGKGVVEDDRIARDTMVITRETCERLFDASFRLARRRRARGGRGRVTCVDKSNVFASMAFFRRVFDERAARHPDIEKDYPGSAEAATPPSSRRSEGWVTAIAATTAASTPALSAAANGGDVTAATTPPRSPPSGTRLKQMV